MPSHRFPKRSNISRAELYVKPGILRPSLFDRPPVLSGERVATFESFMVFLVITRLQLHGLTRSCCGMASSESYLLLCLRNSSPSGGGELATVKEEEKGLSIKLGLSQNSEPQPPWFMFWTLLPLEFQCLIIFGYPEYSEPTIHSTCIPAGTWAEADPSLELCNPFANARPSPYSDNPCTHTDIYIYYIYTLYTL